MPTKDNAINAPPFQKWDEVRFSEDPGLTDMNFIQVALYRTLCQKAWTCNTRPDLPNDDDELRRLVRCRMDEKHIWDENKGPVLAMFTAEEVGGIPVLYRNRIRRDWAQHIAEKVEQAERGRKGGLAKAQVQDLRKPINIRKEIPVLCRELLRRDPEPDRFYKDRLTEIEKAHGGNEVADAFRLWATEEYVKKDERYPISKFVQVAERYFDTDSGGGNSGELDAVCDALYEAGGQAFVEKNKHTLAKLIKDFGSEEVISAYRKFISTMDDFQLKRSADQFCGGGAEIVIRTARRRAEETAKTKAFVESEEIRLQREADSKAEEQKEEEDDFLNG